MDHGQYYNKDGTVSDPTIDCCELYHLVSTPGATSATGATGATSATGATGTITGTVPPVVLITSSEPTFSSNNPPSDRGLQNPTEHTDIIPIIAGAVGGGVLLIVFITTLCVVVVLVRCNSSHKRVAISTKQGAQEKTDLEKGSGVSKQSEVENYKSNIKLKPFTQKVGSEEPTIDPEKCNGTAVSKPTTVGNTKRNKPDKQKPPQPNVACDDSEIATGKGKLADANSTTTTTTTAKKITIRAAKTTKPTKTPETTTTTTTTVMIAKPTSAAAPMTTKTKMATKTKTAETTTANKSGNATSNVQGKSSLHVKKPESNKLKPAPLPPTSRRDESTSQPVSKKQENVATSQKKTGNRSEPRKNSSSADQITAPSERTSGLVKQLPPLGKPSGATKKQGVNSGEECSETSLIQILLGPK